MTQATQAPRCQVDGNSCTRSEWPWLSVNVIHMQTLTEVTTSLQSQIRWVSLLTCLQPYSLQSPHKLWARRVGRWGLKVCPVYCLERKETQVFPHNWWMYTETVESFAEGLPLITQMSQVNTTDKYSKDKLNWIEQSFLNLVLHQKVLNRLLQAAWTKMYNRKNVKHYKRAKEDI
jgi:hypothetical protein